MEEFFGAWLVQVTKKNADFSERFRIVGSDGSDGVYYGIPGVSVQVSGEKWGLVMEWNDGVSSGWQPSAIRTEMSYTVEEGLIKVLGADDNLPNQRDYDFNDLIVTCKSLDPSINPISPVGKPFDFTFPENFITHDTSYYGDDKGTTTE